MRFVHFFFCYFVINAALNVVSDIATLSVSTSIHKVFILNRKICCNIFYIYIYI